MVSMSLWLSCKYPADWWLKPPPERVCKEIQLGHFLHHTTCGRETGRVDCNVHLNSLALILQRDCFFHWLQWQSSHFRSPCRTGVLVDPDEQLPKLTVVTNCGFLVRQCSSIASLGITLLVAASFAADLNWNISHLSFLHFLSVTG